MKEQFKKFLFALAVVSVFVFTCVVFYMAYYFFQNPISLWGLIAKFWRALVLCMIVFVMCEVLYRISR